MPFLQAVLLFGTLMYYRRKLIFVFEKYESDNRKRVSERKRGSKITISPSIFCVFNAIFGDFTLHTHYIKPQKITL